MLKFYFVKDDRERNPYAGRFYMLPWLSRQLPYNDQLPFPLHDTIVFSLFFCKLLKEIDLSAELFPSQLFLFIPKELSLLPHIIKFDLHF